MMRLRFLDRDNERSRLIKTFALREGSLICLYGRRRCGKSRLLQETLPPGSSVYYVGDEREPPLQRDALAESMATMLPGFNEVSYPDWNSILERWYREASGGTVLALDEFPYLVSGSPELPSIVQRLVDRYFEKPVHLVIAGSSQRMMQGIVLGASAPLYGRAREIMEILPLRVAWLKEAFGLKKSIDVVEAWSVWGGIPRYWELAVDYPSTREAVRTLVLDPRGVLHSEPRRLLLDDLRETTQAASILSLIGRGCGRLSEIAGRLGKPATSMTRPLSRLIELGLVRREIPFGAPPKSSRKSFYRIHDPFLSFWFKYVEPARSRLDAGDIESVATGIEHNLPAHQGEIWETLVRNSIPLLNIEGIKWKTAKRWWGGGTDRKPFEIDLVAESVDGKSLLLGEVKLAVDRTSRKHIFSELKDKSSRLPLAGKYDRIILKLFAARKYGTHHESLVPAEDVISALA